MEEEIVCAFAHGWNSVLQITIIFYYAYIQMNLAQLSNWELHPTALLRILILWFLLYILQEFS